jgi:hypothetical protein
MLKWVVYVATCLLSVAAVPAAAVQGSGVINPLGTTVPGTALFCDGIGTCGGRLTGDYVNFGPEGIAGIAASIPGNTGSQIAVLGGNSATLTVNRSVSVFSFDWGSADATNILQLFYNDSVLTIPGTLLPFNDGDEISPNTNFNFSLIFSEAVMFRQAVFTGQMSDAFVFDNVRINAVPEPASWALLITGFGLVGAISRRRRYGLIK